MAPSRALVRWLPCLVMVALASTACAATATSEKAVRECRTYDAATIAALKEGRKRLVVVVKSFRPAEPAAASIVVSLLSSDRSSRREVGRFGIHPPKAFTAASTPQRFLVSLPDPASLAEGRPVCFEVGFATSAGAPAGGAADIDIELVDLS